MPRARCALPAGTRAGWLAASKAASRRRHAAGHRPVARGAALRMRKRPTWASPASGPRAGSRASGRRSTASPAPGWSCASSIRARSSSTCRRRQVLDAGQRLEAVAYDIDGAPVTHEGELCSFDALLQPLSSPTRAEGAGAHRARRRHGPPGARAAVGRAAGVLTGLSRLHAHDDHAMLQAALPLYDALYAWCRNARASAHVEGRGDGSATPPAIPSFAARTSSRSVPWRGAEVLAEAGLHQLRRAGRADRDHAQRAGGAENAGSRSGASCMR
jgi:hypothetical protein